MTKAVHIINGDTSNYRVKVLLQDSTITSEGKKEWATTEVLQMYTPGQLTTRHIWDSRRIIIEEDGSL